MSGEEGPVQPSAPYLIMVARAPGRVNLIGDHTDYNDGVALPMAIDLATEVDFTENDSDRLVCVSSFDSAPADLPRDLPFDAGALDAIEPAWARLPAAMAAQARPHLGGVLRVTGTLPVGAGLSSSASVAVGCALAFGVDADPVPVAKMCQRAEAVLGVRVGLMDPLVCVAGRAGHALLIDFADLSMEPVAIPEGAEITIVHSGVDRELSHTPYAARRAECESASIELGQPLGKAEVADLPGIHDPVLRVRARHVISECARVHEFADALRAGDLPTAGKLLNESHRSIAEDFAASIPEVDSLVADLVARGGVYGARMTGGGFGGCVVAIAEPGALDPASLGRRAWRVSASRGATVSTTTAP